MRIFFQTFLLVCAMIFGIGIAHAQPARTAPIDVLPVNPATFDNVLDPAGAYRTTPGTTVNLIDVGPARIMTIILSLFTLVGIIIGIYAGTQIIFSGGDSKKVEVGVKTLIYTGVGMIVVGMAWVLVRLVLNIDISAPW